jgi:hypothetical protein
MKVSMERGSNFFIKSLQSSMNSLSRYGAFIVFDYNRINLILNHFFSETTPQFCFLSRLPKWVQLGETQQT